MNIEYFNINVLFLNIFNNKRNFKTKNRIKNISLYFKIFLFKHYFFKLISWFFYNLIFYYCLLYFQTWLVVFPEGTRYYPGTPKVIQKSEQFARDNNLQVSC